MIKHVIMWKLKDEALDKTKLENAKIIKEQLESLVGVIDEIKVLQVGINILDGDDMAYDVCLISEFEDLEALDRYKVHPEHQKVAQFVKEVRVSRTSVDFEF